MIAQKLIEVANAVNGKVAELRAEAGRPVGDESMAARTLRKYADELEQLIQPYLSGYRTYKCGGCGMQTSVARTENCGFCGGAFAEHFHSTYGLTEQALVTLAIWGVTAEQWIERHGHEGMWLGDRCGCTDDRCIGFHHLGEEDCGCLTALLEYDDEEAARRG